jgi:antitoxin YefM
LPCPVVAFIPEKRAFLDGHEVTKNREVVIIQRRGREDIALITADELAGILETAHLFRSPNNANRLLTTLDKVRNTVGAPQTIDELRNEVGFE